MSNTNIWFIIPTFSLSGSAEGNYFWAHSSLSWSRCSYLELLLLSGIISLHVKQLWKVNMSNELAMGYHMDYNIFLSYLHQ